MVSRRHVPSVASQTI